MDLATMAAVQIMARVWVLEVAQIMDQEWDHQAMDQEAVAVEAVMAEVVTQVITIEDTVTAMKTVGSLTVPAMK